MRRLITIACCAASGVGTVSLAGADPSPRFSAENRSAAESGCHAHDPSCDWLATLGGLERMSVVRALAARGLELDAEPWNKVIDHVEVYNEDVFVEGGPLFHFFNHFHYTTREAKIRGELVIGAGEVWDQDRVEESARRLHDPLYTSVVAALPVKSKDAGKVVLLVVTRDIFSLRLNTTYIFQQGTLTNLNFSLSENNFLGTRDVVAAAVSMDLGAMAVGPLFLDKNFLGKHIVLSARVDDIITRQALPIVKSDGSGILPPLAGDSTGLEDAHRFHNEGTDSSISITKPLWSLASEWGGGVSFSHSYAIARRFEGIESGVGLRAYDDPDTAEVESIPQEYEIKRVNVTASAVRQWGTTVKQQFSFGYSVSSQRPSLLSSFPTNEPNAAALEAAFTRDVLPPTQLDSAPFIDFTVFQPRFKTFRNIQTYDLAEDGRFGVDGDVSITQGLKVLGSDDNFTRASLSLGYTWPWCHDGSSHLGAGASVRRQDGDYIDNTASVAWRFVTPARFGGRLLLQGSLFTRWNDTQNATLQLGSDSGLRGYNVQELFVTGSGRVGSAVIEARSTPVPVWVLRLGGVAFYEIGGVANQLTNLTLFHDVGLGLRMLVPQSSRELFRFDFAVPLRTDPVRGETEAGQIRFIAGFDSYF